MYEVDKNNESLIGTGNDACQPHDTQYRATCPPIHAEGPIIPRVATWCTYGHEPKHEAQHRDCYLGSEECDGTERHARHTERQTWLLFLSLLPAERTMSTITGRETGGGVPPVLG